MRAVEFDFYRRWACGGVAFYPYQIAVGVSLRYWPCLYMPSVRVHIGPLKLWLGVRVWGGAAP